MTVAELDDDDGRGDLALLSLFVASLGWRDRARCRSAPTELFYPRGGDPFAVAVAKRICARCPVRVECAAYACAAGEVGIWGGLSDDERRRMPR